METTRDMLYNGLDFPAYIFTDAVKSYLFVDFDIVFMDQMFWQIMKSFLEKNNVSKIVVENLEPNYPFSADINVAGLPSSFLDAVQSEKLEGYFPDAASLHMITIKTLIYPTGTREVFCLLLDRDYSIGIIGFVMSEKPEIFNEYEIKNLLEGLKVNFAGNDLPDSLKHELSKNWRRALL